MGPSVPRRPDPTHAPLSAPQHHTWRYQQAHPGSLSNNLGLVLTFTGLVDENALAQAMDRIVACHESLRTTYHQAADGSPFQRIHQQMRYPCTLKSGTAEQALEQAQTTLAQPFDLSQDAPLRLLITRTAPDQVMMALIIHHIIWDGATFDVLCRALSKAYQAPLQPLPALAFDTADLAAWSCGPDRPDLATQRTYWQHRLSAPFPTPTLVSAHDNQRTISEQGGRVDHQLSSPAALQQLAARNRVTPFIAFLGCWAAVLGEQALAAEQPAPAEVAMGTTVLDRTVPGAEQIIGNWANHLVLRIPVGPSPASAPLIAAADAEFEAAFANRALPFEQMEALVGGQDPRLPPRLFDSLVIFIPSGTDGPQLPNTTTHWHRLHNQATQFPLVPLGLEVFVRGRGPTMEVAIEATYARDLFDPTSIGALLYRLDHIITTAASEAW